MNQEFEFNYIKFFRNPLTHAKSAEKKIEVFDARDEEEAGKYLVAFCLERGHGYAEGTFCRRVGANKEKLRDPTFPRRPLKAA